MNFFEIDSHCLIEKNVEVGKIRFDPHEVSVINFETVTVT